MTAREDDDTFKPTKEDLTRATRLRRAAERGTQTLTPEEQAFVDRCFAWIRRTREKLQVAMWTVKDGAPPPEGGAPEEMP